MRKYDLMFGCLGNGITVCDRSREEHGDYKTIAHIDPCGAVQFYEGSMPPDVRTKILNHAGILAGDFRDMFLRLRREQALDMLNDRLNVGQFLLVFQEGKIYEKSMEEIYQSYIDSVCRGGHRVMPPQ